MSEIALQRTGTDVQRDNRVLGTTRVLSAVIVPFLLVAFYILYLRTSETGALFAWEIAAPMTSRMLASAYLGGAYFFTRAIFARRWSRITVGFLPVTTFASFMCVATLLHWDRFNHGHVSFYAWVILYLTTPVLVLLAWLRNRRTDDGQLEDRDFRIPRPIQWLSAAFGVFYLVLAVLLMINPTAMIGIWPWPLTPLTARVVGGLLALFGVFGLTIAAEGRWSAYRIPLQSMVVALASGMIGAWIDWGTFDTSRWFTWVYLATGLGLLVAAPLAYALIERRLATASSGR